MEVAFLLLAGSPIQNTETHFRSELRERERDYFSVGVGVFQLRNWSAIYSAPGGAKGSEPNERLQPFDPAVASVGSPTDAERFGSVAGSGAGMLATHTRETRFKKNQAG